MAYDAVMRWLGEQGATCIEQLVRRGRAPHPRLRFQWRGEEWIVVISASPSDRRAERNAISELRHLMGLVGGKRVGARRAKRQRRPFDPKAVNDPAAQNFRQFAPRGAVAKLADVWPELRA